MSSISKQVAKILIETGCVKFNTKEYFTFTSGEKSPVYVDCRRLISFPRAISYVVACFSDMINAHMSDVEVIAGGETAGIPYASFLAYETKKPMVYIRKKPKGFGMNAQIEGFAIENKNTLLIEDLMTDGKSKVNFISGLRNAGAIVKYCMVLFEYGIFQNEVDKVAKENNVQFFSLTKWEDILQVIESDANYSKNIDVDSIKAFLLAPAQWRENNV